MDKNKFCDLKIRNTCWTTEVQCRGSTAKMTPFIKDVTKCPESYSRTGLRN